MKISKIRGFAVLMLSIALIISIGCEGPEGPTGPAGEQGLQGEQGPQGPAGNANVVSITLPDSVVAWEEGSYLGTTSSVYSFTAEEVDQDIIDHELFWGILIYSEMLGTSCLGLGKTMREHQDSIFCILGNLMRLHFMHMIQVVL